jgi:predicted Zn-dependent protease
VTVKVLHRVAILLPLATLACSTTSTGRSRLALFSESYMNQLGAESYDAATIGEYRLIDSGPDYEMVQRIGQRIAAASGKDYAWEFRLLDAPDVVNAFCLPGGKVAVYTGILALTQNEDALAAVIGHEVAHATEEHGNERMSQQMGATIGMTAAQLGLEAFGDLDGDTKGAVLGALGVGAQYGVLMPFSRTHEAEADHVGLIFLVRAGYDPYEAPKLWERMAQASPERQPEFLSTHPDPANRAEELRRLIPEVLAQEGKTPKPKKQLDGSQTGR